VRVPFIVRWPGHVPSRIDDTSVVAGCDFLPTLCKLAGAEIPKEHALDGEDVGDILTGQARVRKTPLMWNWRFRIAGEVFHHSPMLAIREGDYKLLQNADGTRVELYDIPQDPTQLSNIADRHPAVVEEMSQRLRDWSRSLPPGPTDLGAGLMNYSWPGKEPPPGAPRAGGAKGKGKAKTQE
jgi:arylsulfatase A-like enzyme